MSIHHHVTTDPRTVLRCWRFAAFFVLFTAMCWGFGYHTLFEDIGARTLARNDAPNYYAMAQFSYENVPAPFRSRVLTPTLAGLIRSVLPEKMGAWDVTALSLLIVNALFMAGCGLILMQIARRLIDDPFVEAVAPLALLSSFGCVNFFTAGLVDAGEAFFLAAAIYAILRGAWFALPLLVAVGVLEKQTVAPFALVFAACWCWFASRRGGGGRQTLGAVGLDRAGRTRGARRARRHQSRSGRRRVRELGPALEELGPACA